MLSFHLLGSSKYFKIQESNGYSYKGSSRSKAASATSIRCNADIHEK